MHSLYDGISEMVRSTPTIGQDVLKEIDRQDAGALLTYEERQHLKSRVLVPDDLYEFALRFEFIRQDEEFNAAREPPVIAQELIERRSKGTGRSVFATAIGELLMFGIPSFVRLMSINSPRLSIPRFKFRIHTLLIITTLLCALLFAIRMIR